MTALDSTPSTPAMIADLEQLDTEILAIIAGQGGGPVAWADVRASLPRRYRPWQVIRALCRLRAEGKIDADKHGGATLVVLAP